MNIPPKALLRDKPSRRSRWVSGSKAALARPKGANHNSPAWQHLHGTSAASRLGLFALIFMLKGETDFHEQYSPKALLRGSLEWRGLACFSNVESTLAANL
jgi:hypothetical protein